MRRFLALVLVTLFAVAGCAKKAEPAVDLPTGPELVAQWSVTGGMMPARFLALEAPLVSVYADGLVVTSATKQLMLSRDDVALLVGQLRADLAGLGPSVHSKESESVFDAGTDTLEVYENGALRSVQAGALGIVHDYPSSLEHAATLMRELSDRVGTGGSAFTSDRVRLVAEPGGTGEAAPWPSSVPVPTAQPQGRVVLSEDLSGSAAALVMSTWPHTDGGPDPVAKLPDGGVVTVGWRYLLRHE